MTGGGPPYDRTARASGPCPGPLSRPQNLEGMAYESRIDTVAGGGGRLAPASPPLAALEPPLTPQMWRLPDRRIPVGQQRRRHTMMGIASPLVEDSRMAPCRHQHYPRWAAVLA